MAAPVCHPRGAITHCNNYDHRFGHFVYLYTYFCNFSILQMVHCVYDVSCQLVQGCHQVGVGQLLEQGEGVASHLTIQDRQSVLYTLFRDGQFLLENDMKQSYRAVKVTATGCNQ